jgi:hypothetical protein
MVSTLDVIVVEPGPPPLPRLSVPLNVVVHVPGSNGPVKPMMAACAEMEALNAIPANATATLRLVIRPPSGRYRIVILLGWIEL